MRKTIDKHTWILSLALLLIFAGSATGQKVKPRIQLDYFNNNGKVSSLVATVKVKEDRSYVTVPGVKVTFYMVSDSLRKSIGNQESDDRGKAIQQIPNDKIPSGHMNTFIAAIEENEEYSDYEKEIEILPANLGVEFDTTGGKTVRASIEAPDSTGTYSPVAGVGVKVYVRRLFGELPVSVDFNDTDESGQVDIDFPDDIPGDTVGTLSIIVKIQDHELFGNLIHTEEVGWGVPVHMESGRLHRELWSARMNAPIYLIIIVNAVLLGIWGTIVYIIIGLARIRKLGEQT